MSGRTNEIVETLDRRNIHICCLQETRWRGGSARMLTGKNSRYKFFWNGDSTGTGGVGFLVAEDLADKILSVKRIDHRLMSLRVLADDKIIHLLSAYAPQCGRSQEEKDKFYDSLMDNITAVPEAEFLIVGGDLNGHVGSKVNGFRGIHGGQGYGTTNEGGIRILDLCSAVKLVVTNTFFKKPDSQIITYKSGDARTQVDYILVRQCDQKHVRDVKVIGSEECVTQHKLLVSDLNLVSHHRKPRSLPTRRRIWRLRQDDILESFYSRVSETLSSSDESHADTEQLWMHIKNSLLNSCEESCGWTKGGRIRPRETWWWNDQVEEAITMKRRKWKEWQKGGSREEYNSAKRDAKSVVYRAKKAAQQKIFQDIDSINGRNHIYKLAKQMKSENQDIIGEKCVKDDNGVLTYSDQDKLNAWKNHYEKLLNEEFPWSREHLSSPPPTEGPPIQVKEATIDKAIRAMKSGKAAGPSGIVAEMIKAACPCITPHITALINSIITHGAIPDDWNLSYIINCYKGKGDPLLRTNYRGLKLLDQMLKLTERVMENIIRKQVEIDSMQFGFMPGRGTTDAIFIVRQMQEKHLTKHKSLFFAFVDLEKAFDRVPRIVLWWALRSLGVEEWVVRVTQAMYQHARSVVRVNSEYSQEFEVKVGVHQGSVLSPLLFICVMEALSRDFRRGCPWELLYADDLVIMADTLEEVVDSLSRWKAQLESKGLKVNMGKTKVLISSHDRKHKPAPVKYPCGVCQKGVGNNSIHCQGCNQWVHKRCSGLTGRLQTDPAFRCRTCQAESMPTPAGIQEVSLGGQHLEVVDSFCYLGDVVGQAGGCYDATTARIRTAWGKFRDLLPIITNRGISLKTRGHLYNTAVRSVLLYGSETWPLTTEDTNRLIRNDNSMIRWICSVKLAERKPMNTLRSMLNIPPLPEVCRSNRLRWFGHLERMEPERWPRKIADVTIDGATPRGRPRKRWSDCIKEDLRVLKLSPAMAQNRLGWRRAIRPTSTRDRTNRRTRQTPGNRETLTLN
jgi:hypothetical protein